ncbi:MAG TPA: lysine biosynthesis protein LysW [Levilinea sp.]|nr:lysine biosynthesis protein LysW [Levilinea sp.]
MTPTANCPECDAAVDLEGMGLNEIVVCADCGADLELVSLEPVQLDLAPVETEDWGE